jgi:N-acylneuraminate cytidylyltransferase
VTVKVAIIPARGGSKRIPDKNIIEFCGRPMLAWTVKAALDSGRFDDVIVSTDSQRIADVALAAGASVPFLRREHSDDHSTVSQATTWTADEYERTTGRRVDVIAQLMANCPLRTAADIAPFVDAFASSGAPTMISCTRFRFQNPWWAFLQTPSGPQPVFPSESQRRSQDLPDAFAPTGSIWMARREALAAHGTFYAPGHERREISWVAGVDIDDEHELAVARMLGESVLR